jgi:diacylglycerol kinase (ATP)
MKKQLKSFFAAFSGIGQAILTEGHLRFHTVAAVYVIAFSFFYELSAEKWAVVIMTIALVISAELVNSAAESLCDRITKDYDPIIKRVKDISAAAVLVLAAGAVCVAFLFYFDIDRIVYIFNYITGRAPLLILFLLSLIISVLFIVPGPLVIAQLFKRKRN